MLLKLYRLRDVDVGYGIYLTLRLKVYRRVEGAKITIEIALIFKVPVLVD